MWKRCACWLAFPKQCWRDRVVQDREAAEQYAQTAVDMAEQLNAPSALSAALNVLSLVHVAKGRFRRTCRSGVTACRIEPLVRFHRPTRAWYISDVRLVYVFIDIGDYERALAYLQEAERLADQTHVVGVLAGLLHLQATMRAAFRPLGRRDTREQASIIATTSPYPASDV